MCTPSIDSIVVVRSGGELGSGIAHRLHQYGFRVCITEIPLPLAVSRGNSYCEAIFEGRKTIQGISAVFVSPSVENIVRTWAGGDIPLVIDPLAVLTGQLKPDVLVDATMRKKPGDARLECASLVIGVGPGFYAGRDVHIVIESEGADTGRAIFSGEGLQDTGAPVKVDGFAFERVIWAPCAGLFVGECEIGDPVRAGDQLATINGNPLTAPISGTIRGILRSELKVRRGCKLIEIDPVNDPEIFCLIREKTWTISSGIAEAILRHAGRHNADFKNH